jgi:Protein of unknown function (DUF3224)
MRTRARKSVKTRAMVSRKTRAKGMFEMKKWDEKPHDDTDGLPRLTRATATQVFGGDIEGQGAVEYLMMYRNDNSASYLGLLRVVGRVNGRAGSFVFQCMGTYEGGTARCSWSVVPGSGTAELRGLRGDGGYSAQRGCKASYTFDYDIE